MNNFSVVFLSSRETCDTLSKSIQACLAASHQGCNIEIIVNGNPLLAVEVSLWLDTNRSSFVRHRFRVWQIKFPDKANAINQYIENIHRRDLDVIFLDGYVKPEQDSIINLLGAMRANHRCLAATGVPSKGFSAKRLRLELLANGGLHGNMFALKHEVVSNIRNLGFRLPIVMYRVDGVMGAFLSIGLNVKSAWDPKSNIIAIESATWSVPGRRFSMSELKVILRRRIAQSAGVFENAAVGYWLLKKRRMPSEWPQTMRELVFNFRMASGEDFKKILGYSFFRRIGYRSIEKRSTPEATDLAPSLQWSSDLDWR